QRIRDRLYPAHAWCAQSQGQVAHHHHPRTRQTVRFGPERQYREIREHLRTDQAHGGRAEVSDKFWRDGWRSLIQTQTQMQMQKATKLVGANDATVTA